ncbi:MAG: Aminoacyltransferase femX [Frankiales bacterium]|nr:Aminoacyltransferase femX [Frankiales bacterium]
MTTAGATLHRVPLEEVDWTELASLPDRVLFQSRPWLEFLQEAHGVTPVVAELRREGRACGWFTGLLGQHAGLRVLGSPMPGWATQYMGFNLLPGTTRAEAVQALPAFAFGELRCAHVEVCDRWSTGADLPGWRSTGVTTFTLDLAPSLPAITAGLTSGTRQNLRKGERVGLQVEDAEPAGFAADYYGQLQDVFAKQRLVPTYSQERVEQLVRHLHPTGALQLVRVRDAEGTSVATALVLGLGRSAYFWGGASWRQHQHLRPNEALFLHAFTTWKDRGATEFDFGGGGEYKRKYGATEVVVPHARCSRWPGVEPLRSAARAASLTRQRLRGRRLTAASAQ